MDNSGLSSWLSVWHPRYRWLLLALLAVGSAAGGIVYLENSLLQALVESLGRSGTVSESALGRLAAAAAPGAMAPFALLGAIFAAGLLRAFAAMRRDVLAARLFVRSREDLEREILRRLLERDDAFYSEHSMGEILNRLEVDLIRALDRRQTVSSAWWSSLLILSNLVFFGLSDWRLALVVIGICVVGTLYTQWVSKPIRAADQAYFAANDQVKMDFEDYLKAVPEVQVGGLFEAIVRRFARPQEDRFLAYMDWVRADIRVSFARIAWPVVAFFVTVVIVLVVQRAGSGDGSESLALIPVLIFALPGIFGNVTYLTTLRINYQLAQNSIGRLLEYEDGRRPAEGAAPAAAERAPEEESLAIRVEAASFRYRASSGELQGGVSEIDADFRTGRWYAVVGGAGSGKSTFINMLLGRSKPQAGSIVFRLGDAELAPERLPEVATLMPQRVVLFDASIRENVLLGASRSGEARELLAGELDTLEDVGLGAVCRLKALEMRPVETPRKLDRESLAALRTRAREAASRMNVPLAPFEESHVDPARPVLDALVGGRTDYEVALPVILERDRAPWLKKLADSALAAELAGHAAEVVDQSRNLLEMPSYRDFTQISVEPVEERVWRLRRELLAARGREASSFSQRACALRVALTSKPSEWALDQRAVDALFSDIGKRFATESELLRRALAGAWRPFEKADVHPYLTWRDNLLFAAAAVTNQRARRRLDAALLEIMGEGPAARFFIEQGLEFGVGRNGSRLSGGQGQLVSLARALLRNTPLLVVDEPTSALDPASRDRVGRLLREWKERRVVIAISHDPELIRMADEILVMGGGRLAGRGSFAALEESCDAFRRIFKAG